MIRALFDLVFADPPYDDEGQLPSYMLLGQFIDKDGILVYSQPESMNLIEVPKGLNWCEVKVTQEPK
jgi:16S rRNA G966 N2-methylase RsmD